jgi:hypothetical protein
MRMRHIVACGLSVSTIFFHIISKEGDFLKKFIQNKMFDFVLSRNLSGSFLKLKLLQDININVFWFSCTVRVILAASVV